MKEDCKENYEKIPEYWGDLQGLPYDVQSVMHYRAYDCAIQWWIPTVEALDGTPSQDIGLRSTGFTSLDIEKINKNYCGQ